MCSRLTLVFMLAFVLIITSCKDDDDNGVPAPASNPMVMIDGLVTTPSGDPLDHVSVHLIYEMEPSSYYQDETWFDVVEASWVTLQVFDVQGDLEATLVDGLMSAGRYRIEINPYAYPNGAHQLVYRLWTVDRDSLLFLSAQWWLKNMTDVNILAQIPPAAVTDASGHYELSAAAGLSIQLRDELNQYIGTAQLNRLTLLALHPDYPPAWHTLNVDAGGRMHVNLQFSSATELPSGLIVQIGDTTVIIPDSAQQFADSAFSRDAYWLREWQIAASDEYNTSPYSDGLFAWKTEPWIVRRTYLGNASGYAFDILTEHPSEYYDWISRRLSQFGYGWKDTYPLNANVNDEGAGHIWLHPSDPSNDPDDPATATFDGTSQLADRYLNMWIRIPGE